MITTMSDMRHRRTANMILAVYGVSLLLMAGHAWFSGLTNPLLVLFFGVFGAPVLACGSMLAVFTLLLIYEGTSDVLTDIISSIENWRKKK